MESGVWRSRDHGLPITIRTWCGRLARRGQRTLARARIPNNMFSQLWQQMGVAPPAADDNHLARATATEMADPIMMLFEPETSPEATAKSESSSGSGSESALTRRRPFPAPGRKGHFKSRYGCFNCKRRRVKCNEEHPECQPCRRLGLLCDFPARQGPGGSGGSDTPPRPALSTLTFEDLRFYHQFLTVAFPTLPLDSLHMWQQCAAMSHQVSPTAQSGFWRRPHPFCLVRAPRPRRARAGGLARCPE